MGVFYFIHDKMMLNEGVCQSYFVMFLGKSCASARDGGINSSVYNLLYRSKPIAGLSNCILYHNFQIKLSKRLVDWYTSVYTKVRKILSTKETTKELNHSDVHRLHKGLILFFKIKWGSSV